MVSGILDKSSPRCLLLCKQRKRYSDCLKSQGDIFLLKLITFGSSMLCELSQEWTCLYISYNAKKSELAFVLKWSTGLYQSPLKYKQFKKKIYLRRKKKKAHHQAKSTVWEYIGKNRVQSYTKSCTVVQLYDSLDFINVSAFSTQPRLVSFGSYRRPCQSKQVSDSLADISCQRRSQQYCISFLFLYTIRLN